MMYRRIAATLLSIVLLFNFIILVDLAPQVRAATTIYVDDSGGADFTTIQAAVENATAGDTIYVYNGIYYEQIVIDKSINLTGEDRDNTIIDGGDGGIVVNIIEDWVNVSNFKIIGFETKFSFTGIWIESNYNSIHNNTIACSWGDGIFLDFSTYNKISDNNISDNDYALNLDNSHNNIIQNNTISMSDYALRITNSINVTIINNVLSNNDFGLTLIGSLNVNISDNDVTYNPYRGIYLSQSSNIEVSDNDLSFNGDSGLALYSVQNCNVHNNTFNGSGVYIEGNAIEYWITHEIDLLNTIEGKPIYYLKNQTGGSIPAGAGQVILVNCTNMNIANQEIINASIGVALAYCSDINVTQNKVFLCHSYGIYVLSTPNTNISDNNVSSERYDSIYIKLSPNPIVTNNTILEGSSSIRILESPNGIITDNYIDVPGMGIFIKDCGNHTITGNTALSSNRGVELWGVSDGNYIAYNNFSYNLYGIWIGSNCDDNEIINNTLNEGYMGIYVDFSTRNNIIGNEIINNSDNGIFFYASDSVISENVISYNDEYGLFTAFASNLNITKNEFINDGIYIGGSELDHFNSHEIPDDNTVNGNPLYYYKNTSSLNFDGISIGQLILANCTDVNVNNLNINQTDVGIELAYVSNANITGCNISSNDLFGFYIYSSMNVNISDNAIVSNKENGIYLSSSQYNTISENNISFNNIEGGWAGIFLTSSSDNNIVKNHCISNDGFGIRLTSSPNNYILENEVKGSNTGIAIWNSDNCELSNNNVSDNQYGIRCSDSLNVMIMGNNITENFWGMYIDYSPKINITENTISFNERYGIYLYGTEQAEVTLNEFINDGLFLRGWDVLAYNTHDISVNNMVNGKPLYYYKNTTNIDIDGIPVGQLIIANCTDFDVSNVQIEYTDIGIQIAYSSHINVTASTISNNYLGIYSLYTSDNKITGSNITTSTWDGILLDKSINDFISGNYFFSNRRFGIYIYDTSYSTITNNIFVKDGIFIRGDLSSSTSHNIPVSNIVNGRPLYYYKNINGLDINGISVGQLLLANCTGINIMNLQINDTDVGIEFIYTTYLNISSCSIHDNYYGMYAMDSRYSNIKLNSVNLNDADGIYLSYSRYNKIEYNSFSQNNGSGMYLDDAEYNQIFNNSISSNGVTGIFLYDWSSDNDIIGNNISNNAVGIDLDSDSGDNQIYHNNFIDNTIQAREDRSNYWSDDYPSGGNYWSDFSPTCPDLYNGSITPQVSGSPDGICDSLYDGYYFYDYYPLKYPWGITSPDITPPAKIIDLSVIDPTTNSLNLTWTAPGDDDDSGIASGYVVKYSTTGPITEFNWNSASTYVQSWTPLLANSTETYMISGLDLYTTYWFAIRAYDEVGNYGLISNSASGTTLHTDLTPPTAITDLNASIPTNSSITLTWTASADNGSDPASGNASYYDIRYLMGTKITTSNWDSATQIGGGPTPGAHGTSETLVVGNLLPGTIYYFAIKVGDEVTLWSPISNSPNATTLGNDTASPVISELTITPQIQEIHGTVNISAKIMDNVVVSIVNIEIMDPSSTTIGNFTMTRIGDYYYYKVIGPASLDSYSFTIWAGDINDNYGSQTGSFEIVDTTLPLFSNLISNPSPQELHGEVNITVTVLDNVDVKEVWLQILDSQGVELENITMNRLSQTDNYWYTRVYSSIGDFEYYIWAKDESNNWAVTGGSFTIQDTILPIADAGSDQNVQQGTEIVFDGSLSSDNDGVYNYTWTFNYDGSVIPLYGINPSFKFEKIGKYTVTLTIEDPSGNSGTASIWITVVGVDSDGDGLTDYDEKNVYGTDPNKQDTDGDGILDSFEIFRGTDPLVPDKGGKPQKSFLEEFWWIFLIIALIVGLLILIMGFKFRGKEASQKVEDVKSEEIEDVNSDQESPISTQFLSEVQETPPSMELDNPQKQTPPPPLPN